MQQAQHSKWKVDWEIFLGSFDSVSSAQGEHCCHCRGQRLCVGFCDVALLGIPGHPGCWGQDFKMFHRVGQVSHRVFLAWCEQTRIVFRIFLALSKIDRSHGLSASLDQPLLRPCCPSQNSALRCMTGLGTGKWPWRNGRSGDREVHSLQIYDYRL